MLIRCHIQDRCVSFNLWRTIIFVFEINNIGLKKYAYMYTVPEHPLFCLMSIKRMNVNRKEFAHISARMVTSLPCQSGEECTGWQVICLHPPPPPHYIPFAVSYYTFPEGRSICTWETFFANRHPRDTIGLYYHATGGFKEMSSTPSYMSPNAGDGGGGGLWGLNQWVQLCTSRDMEPK